MVVRVRPHAGATGRRTASRPDQRRGRYCRSRALLTGLTPGVRWHYRLVAQSSAGTTAGADASFATPPRPLDPSGRPVRCTIVGTQAADVLRGTSRRDVICGLGGNDVILGGKGNDVIYGGPGADTLNGGRGNDTLRGGPGNDTFQAREGRRDLVEGGRGNDLAVRRPEARPPRLGRAPPLGLSNRRSRPAEGSDAHRVAAPLRSPHGDRRRRPPNRPGGDRGVRSLPGPADLQADRQRIPDQRAPPPGSSDDGHPLLFVKQKKLKIKEDIRFRLGPRPRAASVHDQVAHRVRVPRPPRRPRPRRERDRDAREGLHVGRCCAATGGCRTPRATELFEAHEASWPDRAAAALRRPRAGPGSRRCSGCRSTSCWFARVSRWATYRRVLGKLRDRYEARARAGARGRRSPADPRLRRRARRAAGSLASGGH